MVVKEEVLSFCGTIQWPPWVSTAVRGRDRDSCPSVPIPAPALSSVARTKRSGGASLRSRSEPCAPSLSLHGTPPDDEQPDPFSRRTFLRSQTLFALVHGRVWRTTAACWRAMPWRRSRSTSRPSEQLGFARSENQARSAGASFSCGAVFPANSCGAWRGESAENSTRLRIRKLAFSDGFDLLGGGQDDLQEGSLMPHR